MENSFKQACVEHETRSLTEFLLGVHGHEGWLENYMTSPRLVTIPAHSCRHFQSAFHPALWRGR
jgi:hypothetical protein